MRIFVLLGNIFECAEINEKNANIDDEELNLEYKIGISIFF